MPDEMSAASGSGVAGERCPRSNWIALPRQRLIFMLAGAAVLALGHVVVGLLWARITGTDVSLRPQINLALYVANLFVLGSVLLTHRPLNLPRVAGCTVGYAAVIWLLWSIVCRTPEDALLLALALMVYGSLLGHPWLLGYLYLFLLSQRFMPAYLYPAFLICALLYTTLPPVARAWYYGRERFVPLCHLAGMLLLLALLLPIVYFCTQSSAQDIHARLSEKEVLAALAVSFRTSAAAALIVLLFGVPLAYAMVRRSFPGHALIDTLIDLPIVLPPPIAGITLLFFLGPKAPLGEFLDQRLGLRFMDSEWAIIAAQMFVASPFLIRASMVAFGAVDVRYEHVARTLGATTTSAFFRVTLPMSVRGILIGLVLTWFRAMAEFGSLRILASRPRTIPILTYERFVALGQSGSHSVAVLVLLLSVGVIVGMWVIRVMPSLLGRAIGASDADRGQSSTLSAQTEGRPLLRDRGCPRRCSDQGKPLLPGGTADASR